MDLISCNHYILNLALANSRDTPRSVTANATGTNRSMYAYYMYMQLCTYVAWYVHIGRYSKSSCRWSFYMCLYM